MRFRSPEDPDIKTSQELIVLQIANEGRDAPARRVLIPLPNEYQDLVTISGETFGLTFDASNVRFYTQELAGSKGHNVEITKGAWDAIKTVLTSVIVQPHDTAQPLRKAARKSIAPPQPDRIVTHDVGSAPTKDVIDAARRLSRMSLGPEDKRRRASHRSFVPSRFSSVPPARIEEDERSIDLGDEDERFEGEEEEEEAVLRSRSMSKRQVIASEDEEEDEDEEVEDELQDELHDEDEIGGDVGDGPFVVATGSSAQQQQQLSPSPSQRPKSPPPKTPASKAGRRSSDQRMHASHTSPTPRLKQERDAASSTAPNVKKEGNPAEAKTSKPVPRSQPEDRFVVIIEYDDGSGEETQTKFKTRGRHLVSKVLLQACRTFGIENMYDRSQLVLALDTEEDGEIVEHRYICPADETMANVGAAEESRFIVQVEYDE
ncbi:hypothetical protein DAEQUDRAFT_723060 [Daedalea quercina L-15889]|uniref:Uncharacterized protein n=1 Tax=Daedalea quercina L-15889 TaxID=1314783 RepID=A0A165SR04_9APHY|nr:hypothetical protein DAEQUDRAFT_723060 [Daedalea quercina L-15889]